MEENAPVRLYFMMIFRFVKGLFSKGSGQKAVRVRRSLLRENWWVVLFLVATGGLYWHGICEKENIYSDLQKRIGSVKEELALASMEKEELLRQLNSQSDPEWIELVLMKRLGLVPEGQIKVYFEKAQP